MSDEAREFAEKVSAHLDEGDAKRAKRAFTLGWRDVVPELPLRFSVILKSLDREATSELLKRMKRSGNPPGLKLVESSDGRVAVETVRGKKLQLGYLPAGDAKLLTDLGADAKLYRPQLLELGRDDDGRVSYLAIELVRPEVRICSACGKRHSGAHVNCDACRRRRRRKGPEQFEHTPVSFHETLEAIAEGEADEALDLEAD